MAHAANAAHARRRCPVIELVPGPSGHVRRVLRQAAGEAQRPADALVPALAAVELGPGRHLVAVDVGIEDRPERAARTVPEVVDDRWSEVHVDEALPEGRADRLHVAELRAAAGALAAGGSHVELVG